MYVALGNIRKGNYVGSVGFILNDVMTDMVSPVGVVMFVWWVVVCLSLRVTEKSGERKAEKESRNGPKGQKTSKGGDKLETEENGETGEQRKSMGREKQKKERVETSKKGDHYRKVGRN